MKKQFKTIIAYSLILSGLLSSCKKQDGYSDEVTTTQQTQTSDSTQTAADSSATNNNATPGNSSAGDAGATPNTGAESTNVAGQGTHDDANETKGTGTGTGPGPSVKDGAAYSGPSDPQNEKIKTTKSKAAPQKDK